MSARRSPRSRRVLGGAAALVAVILAALLPACSLSAPPKGYDITASFSRAIGLYPNSAVRVQGINVGEVTKVHAQGNHVIVTMRIESGKKIPTDATAALVPASLLGERYVQIAPVYTGGPTLQDNSAIRKTKVPAEFDELLRSLENFTGAINPKNASDLITNLSTLLAGQGKSLNDLIDTGAGTLQLLSDKSGDLGDIVDSLSTLTTALQSHTGEIQKLIGDYNTLSGVLADNSGNLNRTITSLDALAVEVTDLLQKHAQQLPFDVEQLTHVTRTVDRNFDSLQTLLSSTVRLFDAAGRAYDPAHNALSLNAQVAAGYTGELISYRLRDRISGLCRRLKVVSCSDPATSPFNSLISQIPGLLGKIPGVNGGAYQPSAASTANAAQGTPAATVPTASTPPAGPALANLDLSAAQRASLTKLTQSVLPVLASLDSDQLQALLGLTPDQITALGQLPTTAIPAALNKIRAGSLAPDALLQPKLPLLAGDGGSATVNNLTDALLNALGSVAGS